MESKLVKGLYYRRGFRCRWARGGYNLHFAWSSAFRARDGILWFYKVAVLSYFIDRLFGEFTGDRHPVSIWVLILSGLRVDL